MELKASNFIIALIIIAGIFTPLFSFIVEFAVNYGVSVPVQYNQTFASIQDKTGINTYTETLKESTYNENEPPKSVIGEAVDILGKYFERGYKTVQLIPSVISLFENMLNDILGTNNIIFGNAGAIIYFIVISIISVGFTFLLISALIKWVI